MTTRPSAASPGTFTLVTQYYPPELGAAQVRLGAIVSDLVRRGHEVEVLTALPNYPVGRIFDGWSRVPMQTNVEHGIKVRRVWVWAAMGNGLSRVLNFLSFGVMSLLGLAVTRRTRWVVVEYPTLFGALPAVLVARARRQRVAVLVADLWVDVIVGVGSLTNRRLIQVLRGLERWMLRRADVVTSCTEAMSDVLVSKGVDPKRLAWLPNGADTELFRPGAADPSVLERLGVRDDEHLVLYAGTHGYVHGLEVVLDAARLLEHEPVRFVLVGDGSEKASLLERASEMGLENVTFLDPVSPEDVADMLRCATASLATVRTGDSYRTIRSAKALPAMAAACPVVYCADDEGSRLVASTGAGLVTPAGDAELLAAALHTLIADPALCRELGASGRAWIEANASWHHLVGVWLDRLAEIERSANPSVATGGG